MQIPKSLIWKKYLKIFILILIIYAGGITYSYIFEKDKIAIDKYNFEQLEKVRLMGEKASERGLKTNDLSWLNKLDDAGVKPIKNCYYIDSDNFRYGYIFGFQLESLAYRMLHLGRYYAYPRYNLLVSQMCFGLHVGGGSAECEVTSRFPLFVEQISHPCK